MYVLGYFCKNICDQELWKSPNLVTLFTTGENENDENLKSQSCVSLKNRYFWKIDILQFLKSIWFSLWLDEKISMINFSIFLLLFLFETGLALGLGLKPFKSWLNFNARKFFIINFSLLNKVFWDFKVRKKQLWKESIFRLWQSTTIVNYDC